MTDYDVLFYEEQERKRNEEKKEQVANSILQDRIKLLLAEIDAISSNLEQMRRERDYLARQCERLDDGHRDEKAWRRLAWEACLG